MEQDRLARFETWLREEAGIVEPRRVVREEREGIVVSKFDEGFAVRLLSAVDSLRELFDAEAVSQAYAVAGGKDATAMRVDCWMEGVRTLLQAAAAAGRISAEQRAEIEAGVDSVGALLSSVLWSCPSFAGEFTPSASEIDAYGDVLARMNAANSLFTRYYGKFEGVPVFNHCPGVRIARRLFAQAWTMCTGTPAPAEVSRAVSE